MKAVEKDQRTSPDSWLRFKSESLLGESLAGQRKYAEGEPLLLSGYAGLLQRNDAIPKNAAGSVADAATWIADFIGIGESLTKPPSGKRK